MGKFAIGLSKFHKLKLSDKEKLELIKVFLEFNESFEDLMQRILLKMLIYGNKDKYIENPIVDLLDFFIINILIMRIKLYNKSMYIH